jgi:prepilin-type N-terminal cleavage/methylation domain-containing protein
VKPARPSSRAAGFTLLEVLIALGLFAILAANLTVLTRTTQRGAGQQDELMRLEVLATQTLDRLVLALMAARQEAVEPLKQAPLNDSKIKYMISTGIDANGEVVWGDPESIGLDPDSARVIWRRNPDTEQELRVVWGDHVATAPLGEALGNLKDDNQDGLIDECGLSFHLDDDGRSVVIQLSLARQSQAGNWNRTTTHQRVAFRN